MKSKLHSAIFGVVVGDALGVPVEFRRRDTYTLTGMTGHGTYDQPAGTWSDDSSMTLATLQSLGRLGHYDADDIMSNFLSWLRDGAFTPYYEVFDVGNATQRAVSRYAHGTAPDECGGRGERDNGNGSLMRIMPVAILIPERAEAASALTHAHPVSTFACRVYTDIVQNILRGTEKGEAVSAAVAAHAAETAVPPLNVYSRLAEIHTYPRDKIESSGYVVDTLEAALWAFLTTDSYRECVLAAVNLGRDTDTVGAIAGGLAGLYYGIGGERGIPEEWIAQLARAEWIAELCEKAEARFFAEQNG